MKYILEIDFETKKHCLLCPVRDEETDDCKMQYCKEFTNWEEQMIDCPLKLVEGKDEQTNVKCRYCNSESVEIIARGTESILYKCRVCKMEFAKLNIKEGET